MLSAQQKEILLATHHGFVETKQAELKELLDLVETVIPDKDSQERKEWTTHMGHLCDVWQRRDQEGEDVSWPDPPVNDMNNVLSQHTLKDKLSGYALRDAMRMERKAGMDGAGGVGPARSSASESLKSKAGRARIEWVDRLVLEFKEPKQSEGGKSSESGQITVNYCIACDKRSVGRDSKRILGHASSCQKLKNEWPMLYKDVVEKLASRANSTALATGDMDKLPKLRKPRAREEVALIRQGTVLEHFNIAKLNAQQQAYIDLLLFKVFICCAIPFTVLNNRFFRELLTALAMNYVVPDRSTFFTRHISQETAAFNQNLVEYLTDCTFLTLSFDGWSTRAQDEIYTFHTTTPSRRSFFVDGHVFKGISVTGAALKDVSEAILNEHGAKKYAAVAGDGGANVRICRKLLHEAYPWILNIYDPCHNLNLLLKDMGKLFKDLLSIISSISNYFGKSNYGTYQLSEARSALGITEGIKSASETRFSSSYIQAKAIETCMPAIHRCLEMKTLKFDSAVTKKLIPYLEKKSPSHYEFMGRLSAFIQVLAPGANAILTLEGQNTTCADIFYSWVVIAYHLENLLGNPSLGLGHLRSKIQEVYNHRFDQMMTESSHEVFLLAYWLHPAYRYSGGIQLTMPPLVEGRVKLPKAQQPELYRRFLRSALQILKGEQIRLGSGGKEESDELVTQVAAWAYNLEPFRSHVWDTGTKPLDYWKALERDSNGRQLARVAVKIFSVSPSEICDERTASRLGWFNAMRRSSMTPENLINCTKLYDYYTNGFSDGAFDHRAHVYLPEIVTTTQGTDTPHQFSAPSLMDLLNEQHVSPMDLNISRMEDEWFNQADPYDLDEGDRSDVANGNIQLITRCNTKWNVADFVKLDSPALKALVHHLAGGEGLMGEGVADAPSLTSKPPSGHPNDWDMDDYL